MSSGYFYAAYPASHPGRPGQVYEIVSSFTRGEEKRLRNNPKYTHQLISDAGRRLWEVISYLLAKASQDFSQV